MPNIQVILGSTRQGRSGDKVASWFMEHARARTALDAELVDLRDWPLPFFDQPLPPAMGSPTDALQQRWARQVARADGFVLVAPEYNHGYPAVLKNALDHLYAEWNGKPVAFVGYGGSGGGLRAVEQLRQVVVELEMVPLRQQVAIAGAHGAFDEQGRLRDAARYDAQAGALLDELTRWTSVLATARRLTA
jgi:NAD(P)H-dependent FMN reductase